MILYSGNKKLELRDSLLWDINNPDLEESGRLIIERVLTRGNKQEFIQLLSVFDAKTIKKTIVKCGGLDKRTLNFVSFYFDIPKSKFVCYKKMQSKKTHWNY